ncbi:hypothetical protein EIN_517150, partial [Entamoeba invadens IP1]
MATQQLKKPTPPDDFGHRAIDIVKNLDSPRVDLNIQALLKFEEECVEYDSTGLKESFISFFKSSEPFQNSHKIMSKREYTQFMKIYSPKIVQLVLKCPHEELLRHSLPVIFRIFIFGSLPPNFGITLYNTASRMSGAIVLRAQDILVKIYSSLSATEKNKLLSTSLESAKNMNWYATSLLCKLLKSTFLPSQYVVPSLGLAVEEISNLHDVLIEIAHQKTNAQALRKILVAHYKNNCGDERIKVVFDVLSATSPLEEESEEVSLMIQKAVLSDVPHLEESLVKLGKTDENVFGACLLGFLKISGFLEVTKWTNNIWTLKRAQQAMRIAEEYENLPANACRFVIDLFLEYNALSKALVLDKEKGIVSFKFEGLYGVKMLFDIGMKSDDYLIGNVLSQLFEGKEDLFVEFAVEAFEKNPSQIGAQMAGNVLRRFSATKVISKQITPERKFIRINRKVREGEEQREATIQTKFFSGLVGMTKFEKNLIEETQKDIHKNFVSVDSCYNMSGKVYDANTVLTTIVTDTINDLLHDDYASDTIGKAIELINSNNYEVKVFINADLVNINKTLGNVSKNDGDLVTIQITPGKVNTPQEKEKGTLNNESKEKTPRGVKTPRSVENGDVSKVIYEEPQLKKIPENVLQNVIRFLGNSTLRQNAILFIKNVDKFVEWEGDALRLSVTKGGKQALGIARLESLPSQMTTSQFSEVLKTFKELLLEESELVNLAASVLLKNEEKVDKTVFLMENTKVVECALQNCNKMKEKAVKCENEKDSNQVKEHIGIENSRQVLTKETITVCVIILLNNHKIIPWDVDVYITPVVRALKTGLNQNLFESVFPMLENPPKLVEQCSRVIIEYADDKCESSHPFIQNLLQNILTYSSGMS